MSVKEEDRLETLVVSLLLTCGEITGESLLGFCLYGISEPLEARDRILRLSVALASIEKDGHLIAKNKSGGRTWQLKQESSRDWVNEYLIPKAEQTPEVH